MLIIVVKLNKITLIFKINQLLNKQVILMKDRLIKSSLDFLITKIIKVNLNLINKIKINNQLDLVIFSLRKVSKHFNLAKIRIKIKIMMKILMVCLDDFLLVLESESL